MFEEDLVQVDVIVKVQRAERVHAVESGVFHAAILESVREEIRVDKSRLQYSGISEQRLAGFDLDERDLFEITRIENDMVQDHVLEADVRETAVDVDHVVYRLVELDVRVADIHQCRSFHVIVLAF